MKIAYFGSPEISAILLQRLIDQQKAEYTISLVITQPDKPVGKRLEIQATAVKKMAEAYNVPVFNKPLKTNEKELTNLLDSHQIDLCIIFAYSELISKDLLDHTKFGFWNIHPSLLPLYRGPSPVVYSLMSGDSTTGITLMKLEVKMDTGPIIVQAHSEIAPKEKRNQLETRLTELGATLLIKKIGELIINDKVELKPQNDILATYSRLLKKDHGFISFEFIQKSLGKVPVTLEECPPLYKEYMTKYPLHFKQKSLQNPAEILYNYFRALYPWPGIWTIISTSKGVKRLKITDLDFVDNSLVMNKVQIEGKSETDFKTFNKAYNVFAA